MTKHFRHMHPLSMQAHWVRGQLKERVSFFSRMYYWQINWQNINHRQYNFRWYFSICDFIGKVIFDWIGILSMICNIIQHYKDIRINNRNNKVEFDESVQPTEKTTKKNNMSKKRMFMAKERDWIEGMKTYKSSIK